MIVRCKYPSSSVVKIGNKTLRYYEYECAPIFYKFYYDNLASFLLNKRKLYFSFTLVENNFFVEEKAFELEY